MMERLADIWRRHGRQFLMFGLVGVWNTVLDLAVYTAAIFAGIGPALSNIIAFGVTNPNSYFINSRTTFRRNNKPAPLTWPGYGKFLAAHLVSLAISTATVFFLSPRIGPFPAKFCATAITVLINYGVSALVVFKPERETPDPS